MKSEEKAYAHLMPPETDRLCAENLDLFFRSMVERHMIWRRRFLDKRPHPWTGDPVFRDYKFTNIYRELDRSSQALIHTIILDERLDLENKVWKCLVYRLFNNPETFRLFSFIWSNGIPDYTAFGPERPRFAEALACLRLSGARPFTNAYFVYSVPGRQREEHYAEEVLPALHALVPRVCDLSITAESPYDFIKVLTEIPAVAEFIAFELYRDLMYIGRFTDTDFVPFGPDDFVNVGPGSRFGSRLIFPCRKSNRDIKDGFYELLAMAPDRIAGICAGTGETMVYPEWDRAARRYRYTESFNLTVDNIEHWLCEFSKYWRMHTDTGRRQRFEPVSDKCLYDI